MQAWQDFVAQQNLSDAPIGECAITDLSHLGVIRVSGEDRLTFLQGQLSNDINKVSDTHSQLSSHCSPKGRMLSSFRIVARGEELLLILPIERLEATLKRLRMFVLMSKVTLEDASDSIVRIELSGACAPDLLPLDPPAADNGVISQDDYSIVRIPGDRPRFLVLGDAESMQALWEEAVQTATPTAAASWRLLDIRAGLPTVYESTSEAFVPQMTNMQLVDGVSFTKGCYTGQEVVARMQYLGKLKRRMYRVQLDSASAPQPGDELFSASSASGQGAGRVVDVAPSPDGGFEALVVSEISSAEAADLQLGDADGPTLKLLDVPYAYGDE